MARKENMTPEELDAEKEREATLKSVALDMANQCAASLLSLPGQCGCTDCRVESTYYALEILVNGMPMSHVIDALEEFACSLNDTIATLHQQMEFNLSLGQQTAPSTYTPQ